MVIVLVNLDKENNMKCTCSQVTEKAIDLSPKWQPKIQIS